MQQGFIRITLSVVLLMVNLSLSAGPVEAQVSSAAQDLQAEAPEIAARQEGNDLILQWGLSSAAGVQAANVAEAAEAAINAMPHIPFGGYMLPMQLQTVILQDGFSSAEEAFAIEIEQVSTIPYRSSLQIAEVEKPTAIGWEEEYRSPEQVLQLPSQPVFVLREGMVRGTRVAIIASTLIVSEGDDVKVVYDFQARLPRTRAFEDGIGALMLQGSQSQSTSASSYRSEDVAFTSLAYEPTNLAAAQNAIKIHVTTSGIQAVSGADLIANGVSSGTPLGALQLIYGDMETEGEKAKEIAVELWDSGNNGTLDASDSVRFFARSRNDSMTVGNYWSSEEIYWLTYSGSGGKRMVTRNVVPTGSGGATIRPIAIEKGIWEENKLYESTMPGADNDNWFHAKMRVESSQAGAPSSYPTIKVDLNHKLPLATSSMASNFTLTGSSDSVANHTIQINMGASSKTVNWTNLQYYETWSHTISSTVAHPASLQLTLLPGSLDSDIRLDKIYWTQPVNLDFGNKGAAFSGVSGTWRYQLANVPSDGVLYDITDPLLPQRLLIPSGSNPQFEDGPEPRDYILATVGELGLPTLSPHTPVTWSPSMRGHALYIGYKQYHNALQPLIDFRNAQGYEAVAIDLQSIYDSWSFGVPSPDAIRNMLQYAVNNWALKPVSVVAVGDTTLDPKNYLGKLSGNSNRNLFPAFLESTDPWLGKTACDPCFAQLDDPNPLDGILDKDFLIDIWFGRFSIQDEEQLEAVVAKIVQYGQLSDIGPDAAWRQQSVFVADNYVRSDCTLDSAGDFTKSAEDIISHFQAPSVRSTRVFYDPSPTLDSSCTHYSPTVQPGRYSTPASAQTAALEAYKAGAGLITFEGHSNHFQNGRTEQNGGYIIGFNEILQMKNAEKLPIILEMTCYTGQFQYVSTTGTTMDERFQRQPNGGAVAILSPAGLSVATGHKFLQEGFHKYLWSHPNYQSRLGELVEASYYSLFENSVCCQDVRKTFLLLGDPLTNALVLAPDRVFVPMVQ